MVPLDCPFCCIAPSVFSNVYLIIFTGEPGDKGPTGNNGRDGSPGMKGKSPDVLSWQLIQIVILISLFEVFVKCFPDHVDPMEIYFPAKLTIKNINTIEAVENFISKYWESSNIDT